MALSWTVTLVSVEDAGKQYGGKLLIGSASLLLKDNGIEVLNQTFTAPYKDVDNLTGQQQLNRWALNIGEQMQAAIDNYVRTAALENNAALATTITAIQNRLVG